MTVSGNMIFEKMEAKRNFHFTLIELLVVIAIIAIVVASKAGFFLQFSAIFAFKAL